MEVYLHRNLRWVVQDLCTDQPVGSPRWLLTLVEQFPDNCALAASMQGGTEHRGWGHDRYLMAAIYDAIQANTAASGNWKKKPPRLKPWPRPGAKPRMATLNEALPF